MLSYNLQEFLLFYVTNKVVKLLL